ncbi:MAG: hypothetical protein RL240_1330 [Planctomycetota bacterium]
MADWAVEQFDIFEDRPLGLIEVPMGLAVCPLVFQRPAKPLGYRIVVAPARRNVAGIDVMFSLTSVTTLEPLAVRSSCVGPWVRLFVKSSLVLLRLV